jgi:hypothetical protein
MAELIKYGGEGIIDAMHKLIFMIWRQMMEKHYEHSTDLHMLFLDFRKAVDSVN